MKPLLSIATLLLLFSTFGYSQNISIADFLQLLGENNSTVESRLTALNIQPYDEEEMGSGKTQYTYQSGNSNTTALQWVDFVYAQDAAWNNRISFQTQNLEQVKKYLSEMKNLGFYFSAKRVMDRKVYEVYTDRKNTIELITSQSRKVYDNNLSVNFAFYSAGEYEYAFATENKKFNVAQFNQEELFANLVGLPMSVEK